MSTLRIGELELAVVSDGRLRRTEWEYWTRPELMAERPFLAHKLRIARPVPFS
jgi:hypothetical protein